MTVPRSQVVDAPAYAAAAAREIGTTVVVKGTAPGLFHKSEHRMVELGLVGDAQVVAAAQRIEAAARRASIHTIGYLVMEQVEGQLDVYVGFKRDPQFGSSFLVGLGGVWAEFLHDVAIHVGDLDSDAAHALIDRSTVGAMMRGARGGSLAVDSVANALVAIADVAAAAPSIDAIDVNPLIVSRQRAVAVDAVIEVAVAQDEVFA